jgi:hypothetical protein
VRTLNLILHPIRETGPDFFPDFPRS